MAKDKRYPESDESGSATMDGFGPEATRIKCEADLYKARIAKQFGVQGNWIPTRISGATPFAPKAEMYDELSSAVTAIERGQASKWAFSNLISGMNVPSIDVRDASIELLEVCRVELMKLDEINKDTTLSAQQKKDKIAQEKAFIFGLLGDIRNANAREGTFKWTNDFLSSMGKKFGQSLNRTNFALAILGVAVCVTVSVLATLGTLAFLGVFAPYALPFVIAGVCLFAFCKLVKGVYNAWQDANKLAAKSKSELGDNVLNRVAALDKDDLGISKKARDDAKGEMESTKQGIEAEHANLEAELEVLRAPIQKEIGELMAQQKSLEQLVSAQRSIIESRVKRGADKSTRDQAANAEIRKLQASLKDNADLQAELNLRLKKYDATTNTATPYVRELDADTAKIPAIQTILNRLNQLTAEFPGKKNLYNEKEKAYDAAEKKSQTSQARVDKTLSSAGQKTLKERLGEAEERSRFGKR